MTRNLLCRRESVPITTDGILRHPIGIQLANYAQSLRTRGGRGVRSRWWAGTLLANRRL